jgi:Ca2+-binding RTX toxin-like protein
MLTAVRLLDPSGQVIAEATGLPGIPAGDLARAPTVLPMSTIAVLTVPSFESIGTSFDDLIGGGPGDDTVVGNAGNDTLYGGAGLDQVSGGDGNDLVVGEGGNDFIAGGLGNDSIDGGAADDSISGQSGLDIVFGDAGTDRLTGGAGADVIMGGSAASLAGIETIGNDTFVYRAMTDAGDSIYGFDVRGGDNDVIDLRPLFDALGYAGTVPRTDGYLQVVQSGADVLLQVDPDGSTAGHGFATSVTLVDRTAMDIADGYLMFQ